MQAGGADRDRTDDLLNANQALSQLSYSPWKKIEAGWTRPARPGLTDRYRTEKEIRASGPERLSAAAAESGHVLS